MNKIQLEIDGEKAYPEVYREYIGSQVLYSNISGTGILGIVNLIGAYDYRLIHNMFYNVEIPDGYHIEYRLSCQGSTGGNLYIRVWLNNISTYPLNTWSGSEFREIQYSNFFKESDIVLEPTYGYTHTLGCNLKYETYGVTDTRFEIYNITIHGYIVKD